MNAFEHSDNWKASKQGLVFPNPFYRINKGILDPESESNRKNFLKGSLSPRKRIPLKGKRFKSEGDLKVAKNLRLSLRKPIPRVITAPTEPSFPFAPRKSKILAQKLRHDILITKTSPHQNQELTQNLKPRKNPKTMAPKPQVAIASPQNSGNEDGHDDDQNGGGHNSKNKPPSNTEEPSGDESTEREDPR